MEGINIIQRVFLDVDGVLADFTGGAHKKLGIDFSYYHWPYPKGPEGWDWQHCLGMSFEDISAICDFDFWAGLSWHDDGLSILSIIERHFGIDQITLLTTPMPHPMSASGKMKWIEKNLPQYKWHTIICSEKKCILAQVPDAILIDDCQRNVDQWREIGGKAILVPRLWNNLWSRYEIGNTVIDVMCQLEGLN